MYKNNHVNPSAQSWTRETRSSEFTTSKILKKKYPVLIYLKLAKLAKIT
jgi:hypothetical protein